MFFSSDGIMIDFTIKGASPYRMVCQYSGAQKYDRRLYRHTVIPSRYAASTNAMPRLPFTYDMIWVVQRRLILIMSVRDSKMHSVNLMTRPNGAWFHRCDIFWKIILRKLTTLYQSRCGHINVIYSACSCAICLKTNDSSVNTLIGIFRRSVSLFHGLDIKRSFLLISARFNSTTSAGRFPRLP